MVTREGTVEGKGGEISGTSGSLPHLHTPTMGDGKVPVRSRQQQFSRTHGKNVRLVQLKRETPEGQGCGGGPQTFSSNGRTVHRNSINQ